MFDSVIEAIMHHAENSYDKVAVIAEGVEISYGEIGQKIQQCAALLSEYGIRSGDKVVLASDYTVNFIELYFAVHWLGAINVVVEKAATISSLGTLLKEVMPKLIILNRPEEGAVTYDVLDKDCRHKFCSKGIFTKKSWADILFTTGTTGDPKGVILSHENQVAGAQNVINGGEMSQDDRNLLTMPLHHAFGLTTLRAILYKGCTAVLQDGVASLRVMNDNMKEKACNCVYMVPAALRFLYFQTRQRLDLLLGGVEKIEFCTAPLDKKMRRVLYEQLEGVRLYNSYGATEAARSVYMRLDKNVNKMEAIGQAVKGVSVSIVDNDHETIASSERNIGCLAICGKMNMVGYYKDPDLTNTVLSEGVFYSEDLGYMDKEGYIYLAGRNNDVINIGGEKVSPFEIENAALDFNGVRECACIGVEDPEGILGKVPVLFVKKDVNKDFSITALQLFMKEHLESYKVPYKIMEIEEIPKNYMGKMNRNKLLELWKKNNIF